MSESAPQIPFFTQTVQRISSLSVHTRAHQTWVPGPLCGGVYIPPMGGKRTLSSIRKQSVPHILKVVLDSERVRLFESG
jgi:hypothetical protein